MRPQCPRPLLVRNTVIGGPRPLVCIPLMAADRSALFGQAARLQPLRPDLVEWRADAYDGVREATACLTALERLRELIGDVPLIFTLRIDTEGGRQAIDQNTRLNLIKTAVASGLTDLVDVELASEPAFVEAIRAAGARHACKLILSFHDFSRTPDETLLLDRLVQAQRRGADIAKAAVMPHDAADVLRLLNATMKARAGIVQIPLITLAMASLGRMTRLVGGLFGSDVTFAAGPALSAPGQMPVEDLRRAMNLLYDP